jgi:hypothetical protein
MPDSQRRRYQVLKLLADDLNLVQREPEYEIPLRVMSRQNASPCFESASPR